ncbi:replication initiation regulator SeqA, partial [Pseudoalteromonas sp. SIMBA_153]
LTSGNSTNPKQIPDSPFWVITNTNTTKKKAMLTQVAEKLGYQLADAEKIRDFL